MRLRLAPLWLVAAAAVAGLLAPVAPGVGVGGSARLASGAFMRHGVAQARARHHRHSHVRAEGRARRHLDRDQLLLDESGAIIARTEAAVTAAAAAAAPLSGDPSTPAESFGDRASCQAACTTDGSYCEPVPALADPVTASSSSLSSSSTPPAAGSAAAGGKPRFRCVAVVGGNEGVARGSGGGGPRAVVDSEVHQHERNAHGPEEDHGSACFSLRNCSGHGHCHGAGHAGHNGPGREPSVRYCECEPGWHGVQCSITFDSNASLAPGAGLGSAAALASGVGGGGSLADAIRLLDDMSARDTAMALANATANATARAGGVARPAAATAAGATTTEEPPPPPVPLPNDEPGAIQAPWAGESGSGNGTGNKVPAAVTDGPGGGAAAGSANSGGTRDTTAGSGSSNSGGGSSSNGDSGSRGGGSSGGSGGGVGSDGLTCGASPADDCGEFGLCHGGRCFCTGGHVGPRCRQRGCPDDCHGHGVCALGGGSCACDPGWVGASCAEASCAAVADACAACRQRCHPTHGLCDGRCRCLCASGWAGPDCTQRATEQQQPQRQQ